jgi:hypothetical protein
LVAKFFLKSNYSKIVVFMCLENKYFSFREYFILGKNREVFNKLKNEVLEDTLGSVWL